MAVTSAAGHPAYSGTFIPEIWSTKLLVKLYDACVLTAISNTDYEGEIKSKGDKIYIRQTPDILIRDYEKGQNLVIQRPEATNVEMVIDKAKYFNFICDDIDKYQSDIALMDKWSADASEQMKIAVDTEVLADVYADANASNKGLTAGRKSAAINMGVSGSPVAVTRGNILDHIVNMGTVLDEQNVPEQKRWIVMPPIFIGMLKMSDLKDASLTGDGSSVLRNGRVGMVDRFTIYSSNLLPSTTDGSVTAYHIMAGHPMGISFAAQMTKMESLRAESTFGTLVRGLNVFGYKVTKSEALVDFYATKGE